MFQDRRQQAKDVRIAAAELAAARPHPRHVDNGDEQKLRRVEPDPCEPKDPSKNKSVPSYLASFTKGMPHNKDTGLIENASDFQRFVKGIDSGDPADFRRVSLGPEGFHPDNNRNWKSEKAQNACPGQDGANVRAWESQGAGNTFDLEGPDAQAVTMPPAPAIGSEELIAEMGEVYAQALLRDVPFTQIVSGSGRVRFDCKPRGRRDTTVEHVLDLLNCLTWFKNDDCCRLTEAEQSRKRGLLNGRNAFRGITPGDDIGPYISQFLLAGNEGINPNDKERGREAGLITYGAVTIDQKVRFATPCDDHMTDWYEYLDVQDGADLRGLEDYQDDPKKPFRRFITTPRDLATYVHYDALYEAYLNACLILLAEGTPFDPGIPFQGPDFVDRQQGFAHFGGPHILSLVTEVATRALKAVRFQKFNVHRRLRPEALAARITKHQELGVPEVAAMFDALNQRVGGRESILELINQKNGELLPGSAADNYLLPMAFCEGSPMHPSYGAGHATVAGACVTILKAFFDHKHPLALANGRDDRAFVPNTDGTLLTVVPVLDKDGDPARLTVEGELNKLASNISIGRDWAGVHYFTDYIESIRMGEQIAIGILEEQKLTYGENFSMTVPLYDGGAIRI